MDQTHVREAVTEIYQGYPFKAWYYLLEVFTGPPEPKDPSPDPGPVWVWFYVL